MATSKIVKMYWENGNLKFEGTMEDYKALLELGAFDAPKGKGSRGSKTEKEEKPLTVYKAFNKKTDKYEATSTASKGNNPNAILQIKFNDIPSAKTRSLLKGFGFRWNKTNLSWDNVNNEESQKIFSII